VPTLTFVMVNAGVRLAIPGALLAHQGGWDEMLLVAAPMLLVAGLLWLAKRRATAAGRSADAAGQDDGSRSIAAPTPRSRPTKSS
jgi:hypothetical protein